MMEDMAAKGEAEKKAEIATYQKYMKWCDQTTFEKKVAIRDGKLAVEQGTAAAGKAKADAEAAADKIVELNGNIKAWATQKAEAIKEREVENADYEAEHTEFTENIDALSAAMATIAATMQPVSALIQDANSDLMASWEKLTQKLPTSERAVFNSLLQTDEVSAPAGSAFESSSGGVQDAVGKLKERIEGKRADLEKEETEHKFAFESLVAQLDINTEQANNEIDEKTQEKAQRLADFESYTQEVETTSATLKTDEKYFADLEAQCTTKTEEFEARQKMREEELEAIAKAIDVMSGSTVSGAADEHLPSFIQTRKSFALLRAIASSERSAAVHRVMVFLQGRAKKAESRILANLAAKVTESGPFDKVVEMIKDLIQKLSTEAAEEADQKSWCDAELKSNKETRDAKTEEVNRLTAHSDMLHAQIAQLTSELEELSDQISSLNLALKEATEDRAEEKAANDKAIADAKGAIPAVRSALKVLKDFYAKAATATALVQQSPSAEAPGSWEKPYTGMGGSSKGVLGMLEVILSDSVRLEQETTSSEAEAQSAFDKFSSDSQADIDSKTATSKEKETLKLSKTRDLEDTGKDLKSTQKELDAALAYHEELKPSCVDAGVSFTERSQRRQEEIESLQEALKLLGDE